ncbi:response regulator [Candidatus Campbellbacteria bacterium CG10_big_fil_rev_8_21_14_0_10_35_52]|uniref:Response regulator n=1 Tax=Candidatus Campbellbacteria bacterium CG10_big_fil_rev_8_21_14_0_10_35_52 TaxID=1974527 RepID=A0A2M6WW47_9BACT|nr:MAG: response regulator [Candidatus Campbellbacteria bacterium CG10_big_fil_rev_8_21_14_0_10_35_52]
MDKKNKIFLIDDDNFMTDMYAIKFKEHGFDVSTSLDSKEALDRLRDGFSPDIILFDIIMPKLSGIEFLEIVRKEKLANNTIFIALSNQWKEDEIDKAKSLGIADYIIKAESIPSEVLDKVENIIKKHS